MKKAGNNYKWNLPTQLRGASDHHSEAHSIDSDYASNVEADDTILTATVSSSTSPPPPDQTNINIARVSSLQTLWMRIMSANFCCAGPGGARSPKALQSHRVPAAAGAQLSKHSSPLEAIQSASMSQTQPIKSASQKSVSSFKTPLPMLPSLHSLADANNANGEPFYEKMAGKAQSVSSSWVSALTPTKNTKYFQRPIPTNPPDPPKVATRHRLDLMHDETGLDHNANTPVKILPREDSPRSTAATHVRKGASTEVDGTIEREKARLDKDVNTSLINHSVKKRRRKLVHMISLPSNRISKVDNTEVDPLTVELRTPKAPVSAIEDLTVTASEALQVELRQLRTELQQLSTLVSHAVQGLKRHLIGELLNDDVADDRRSCKDKLPQIGLRQGCSPIPRASRGRVLPPARLGPGSSAPSVKAKAPTSDGSTSTHIDDAYAKSSKTSMVSETSISTTMAYPTSATTPVVVSPPLKSPDSQIGAAHAILRARSHGASTLERAGMMKASSRRISPPTGDAASPAVAFAATDPPDSPKSFRTGEAHSPQMVTQRLSPEGDTKESAKKELLQATNSKHVMKHTVISASDQVNQRPTSPKPTPAAYAALHSEVVTDSLPPTNPPQRPVHIPHLKLEKLLSQTHNSKYRKRSLPAKLSRVETPIGDSKRSRRRLRLVQREANHHFELKGQQMRHRKWPNWTVGLPSIMRPVATASADSQLQHVRSPYELLLLVLVTCVRLLLGATISILQALRDVAWRMGIAFIQKVDERVSAFDYWLTTGPVMENGVTDLLR